MALVLSISAEETLRDTRKLILEQAGYTVVSAEDQEQVITACNRHRFDVAVLGQTVPAERKRTLSSEIRACCPGIKILELYSFNQGRAVADAEAWLEVPAYIPLELVERVNQLLQSGDGAR